MTSEDKQLLLKELSSRSPYGVICQFIWTYSNETTPPEGAVAKRDDNIKCINMHIKEIQADYYDEWVDLEHCKPYLRPMSSMTDEEIKDYHKCTDAAHRECYEVRANGEDRKVIIGEDGYSSAVDLDWLNAHHFDYRGLIEKGIALEAPEGMYKNKAIIYEM